MTDLFMNIRVNALKKAVRRIIRRAAPVAILLLSLCPPSIAGRVPEKLAYDLSWLGIPVGKATQEISEDGDIIRIVSTARSNDWLSVFFPVDDRTESLLTKSGPFPGISRYFRMQTREGGRTRDREITFDPASRTAQYHDRIHGDRKDIPIVEHTYDIYASFYYVRYLDLKVGKAIYLHVVDGKDLQTIEVRVLRKERIGTPVGAFNTIVVKPLVKSEGVFEGKGGVTIWLTDDNRRIPVRAETKVKVGSVTAELTGGEFK